MPIYSLLLVYLQQRLHSFLLNKQRTDYFMRPRLKRWRYNLLMHLSIIIPNFNRRATIGAAIRSVLAQCYLHGRNDWELIVVDDGSSDGSVDYIRESFTTVKLVEQANAGVSAARNAGLNYATGEWIALLDSDDEWLPHKLSAQFHLLQQSSLKVCHTQEIWIRNGVRVNQMTKHQKAGGWIFKRCLPLCAMSPSSIVIQRDVFESIGVFDVNLPACEDYDLWLRITSRYEVAYVDKACINKYGGHEDQLSKRYWGMDRFRVIALEKLLSDPIQSLDNSDRDAAKNMLLKKLRILHKGAIKHENSDLVRRCEESIARFS